MTNWNWKLVGIGSVVSGLVFVALGVVFLTMWGSPVNYVTISVGLLQSACGVYIIRTERKMRQYDAS